MRRQVAVMELLAACLVTVLVCGCPKQPNAGLAEAGPEQAGGAPRTAEVDESSGFSMDLGEPPQFEPAVEGYEVAKGLKNVGNVDLFRADLRPAHLATIAEQGFVVVPADWKQMEFVYELNNYQRQHKPSFVTVDSILHTYHIFYDYVLRTIEVSTLYERVSTMALGLQRSAAEAYERETEPQLKEAALRNYAYALVPVRLLEIPQDQWGGAPPTEVTALADQELALIDEHQGFSPSPTVILQVDYSQFVPRGHYTRSDKLKRYFKAMMWYGLVPVALRDQSDAFHPELARQAVLLAQGLLTGDAGGERLVDVWQDVYEPTAFMVGFADDNTPGDYGKAVREIYGDPLDTAKLIPEADLKALAERVLALRPPGIRMASIRKDPTQPAYPQFKLMGQRFVLDSHIFQMMVYPYVGSKTPDPTAVGTYNVRNFPMGLDAMAALGSARAYEIADTVYKQNRFENYQSQLQKMKQEVEAYTEADWTKTVYAGWLHALKLLLEVKQEGYPSFMGSEAWVDKQLNAALGSWAELRHDTILYAKQSVVVECGGEGGQQKPPPPPKGYVEPEVHTYWRLRLLATQLKDGLVGRELLTDEQLLESFDELISLLKFLEETSIKELEGTALTADEFKQIEYYGDTLARLNLYTQQGVQGDEITSMTDKDMAVIADVHTADIGGVYHALEEGVGHANEIYVVFPIDGKLSLGRGAVFSYHEFTVPIDDRLTDEEWQQRLGSDDPPLPPKWTASFLSKEKGSGESVKFQGLPTFSKGGC